MSDIDFFTPGARLALELECLLIDTRDTAVQSRWWASAHEVLEQWRQPARAMVERLHSACCGNGSFDGPTTSLSEENTEENSND